MMLGQVGQVLAVTTSILPADWCVADILELVLSILVYGLGAAAVVGVIIAGVLYMTARDDMAQVAKAKTRLIEIVVGLIAWALMSTLLNWLIPGGVKLNNGELREKLCPAKTESSESALVVEEDVAKGICRL